jgi:lysine N6-hydroxylase
MGQKTDFVFDAVGVGIGPFNLSVAALAHPLRELRTRFFDRKKEFRWHPGLLFPEATIQVSFLKDLVTLVDPKNPYSFLSFLSEHKRLYRFIIANFPKVTRLEFEQYFQWVCDSLPNLEFGRGVEAVSFDGKTLVVEPSRQQLRARNVILGTGLSPVIPECAQPHVGPAVFHACDYLHQDLTTKGRRVAVIGGGQTGAEVVYHLLSEAQSAPRQLFWISRRTNYLPLDESPFSNELFTPSYSDYFFNLAPEQRATFLAEQKFLSDGISGELLEKIYRRMYELDFLQGSSGLYSLHPCRELTGMSEAPGGWALTLQNRLSGRVESLGADVVILCTGLEFKIPDFLYPLAGRIDLDGNNFKVRQDFSIEWDGPASIKIYAQNAAKHSRGIADPNLSLMAWRSATIINSLMGRCVYDIAGPSTVFDWQARHAHAKMEAL